MEAKEVKIIVDNLADSMRNIADKAQLTELFEGTDPGQLTTFELLRFAMYLSASDGEIQEEEVAHISEIFGFQLTSAAIGECIRNNNIYSTEFENKVPTSLIIFVAVDNALHEQGDENCLCRPASETLFDVYSVVADCIIKADGKVHEQEEKDAEIYIRMLKNYMDENLIVRKNLAKGFTKNGENLTSERMMDIMDKMYE